MNFAQIPTNQTLVYYNGKPYLQRVGQNSGPFMFQTNGTDNPKNIQEDKHQYCPEHYSGVVYPTTHSIPGPFLQSYIALPRKQYPY